MAILALAWRFIMSAYISVRLASLIELFAVSNGSELRIPVDRLSGVAASVGDIGTGKPFSRSKLAQIGGPVDGDATVSVSAILGIVRARGAWLADDSWAEIVRQQCERYGHPLCSSRNCLFVCLSVCVC